MNVLFPSPRRRSVLDLQSRVALLREPWVSYKCVHTDPHNGIFISSEHLMRVFSYVIHDVLFSLFYTSFITEVTDHVFFLPYEIYSILVS